jgi:hypothetical protein
MSLDNSRHKNGWFFITQRVSDSIANTKDRVQVFSKNCFYSNEEEERDVKERKKEKRGSGSLDQPITLDWVVSCPAAWLSLGRLIDATSAILASRHQLATRHAPSPLVEFISQNII